MSASSALPPIAGVLTQPMLAQSLGVSGRGELAAALAPAVLVMSGATLGLPEALTYYVAKQPGFARRAIGWSAAAAILLGGFSLVVGLWSLPFLAAGNPDLEQLIVLAIGLSIPALIVGMLRGAASGRQMWRTVAAERLASTGIRVSGVTLLFLTGNLTVLSAVIVSTVPLGLAGLVYWRLAIPYREPDEADQAVEVGLRPLFSFGVRIWFGAAAGIVLARVGQILMVPLAGVEDLGLFVVAITISDIPLITAIAIREALYGVNSREADGDALARASRLTLLLGLAGCGLLGVTLPLWIGPLFGEEFVAATIPTLLMLGAAVVCIPGLIATSGVAAWGHPGVRSVGLVSTLMINILVLVVTVPGWGVLGGCWAAIAAHAFMSAFMTCAAARISGLRVREFVLIRKGDIVFVAKQITQIATSVRVSNR